MDGGARLGRDKHLDKDILFEGNKIYSADNCVFVTRIVNNFTIDRGAERGKWQVGVHWDEKGRANLNPNAATHYQESKST